MLVPAARQVAMAANRGLKGPWGWKVLKTASCSAFSHDFWKIKQRSLACSRWGPKVWGTKTITAIQKQILDFGEGTPFEEECQNYAHEGAQKLADNQTDMCTTYLWIPYAHVVKHFETLFREKNNSDCYSTEWQLLDTYHTRGLSLSSFYPVPASSPGLERANHPCSRCINLRSTDQDQLVPPT